MIRLSSSCSFSCCNSDGCPLDHRNATHGNRTVPHFKRARGSSRLALTYALNVHSRFFVEPLALVAFTSVSIVAIVGHVGESTSRMPEVTHKMSPSLSPSVI